MTGVAAIRAVVLEPLVESEAPDVFALWSDVEAIRFTNWSLVDTLDQCQDKLGRVLAHYRRDNRHFGPYTIRSELGQFLGITGADSSDDSTAAYELWYFVCRQLWGRGIATAAVRELLTKIVASNRVKHLRAEVASENVASWKLLERIGFAAASKDERGGPRERRVYELRLK
jgi:RimJ/RimL family protein N-acetyltransferase